tara:strand:- start:477 stop:929 length:453 start_codon:yes stop_codon:yes gene_type:complete
MKNNLFPTNKYYNKSYIVNQRFINKNKPLALKRILINKDNIINVFKFFLHYKYKIFEENVFLDIKYLKKQLINAKVSNEVIPWAENEEGQIKISNKDKMKNDEMISVLIHESIHNSVRIKRVTRFSKFKILSCEDEHKCLDLLGDNLHLF